METTDSMARRLVYGSLDHFIKTIEPAVHDLFRQWCAEAGDISCAVPSANMKTSELVLDESPVVIDIAGKRIIRPNAVKPKIRSAMLGFADAIAPDDIISDEMSKSLCFELAELLSGDKAGFQLKDVKDIHDVKLASALWLRIDIYVQSSLIFTIYLSQDLALDSKTGGDISTPLVNRSEAIKALPAKGKVSVACASLSIDDVKNLRIGDVINTEWDLAEPLPLYVSDRQVARVLLGKAGGKKAMIFSEKEGN